MVNNHDFIIQKCHIYGTNFKSGPNNNVDSVFKTKIILWTVKEWKDFGKSSNVTPSDGQNRAILVYLNAVTIQRTFQSMVSTIF